MVRIISRFAIVVLALSVHLFTGCSTPPPKTAKPQAAASPQPAPKPAAPQPAPAPPVEENLVILKLAGPAAESGDVYFDGTKVGQISEGSSSFKLKYKMAEWEKSKCVALEIRHQSQTPLRVFDYIKIRNTAETQTFSINEFIHPSIDFAIEPGLPTGESVTYAGDQVTLKACGDALPPPYRHFWVAFSDPQTKQLDAEFRASEKKPAHIPGIGSWLSLRQAVSKELANVINTEKKTIEGLDDIDPQKMFAALRNSRYLGEGSEIKFTPDQEGRTAICLLSYNGDGKWQLASRDMFVMDIRPVVWVLPTLPILDHQSRIYLNQIRDRVSPLDPGDSQVYSEVSRALSMVRFSTVEGEEVTVNMTRDPYFRAETPIQSAEIFINGIPAGKVSLGNRPNATYRFTPEESGMHTVRLITTDVMGLQREASVNVFVEPKPTEPTRSTPSEIAESASPASPVTVDSVGNDFLDAPPGSIYGQVREDADRDGDLDDPDEGIAGVKVVLWSDPNSDGDPADGVALATTITDDAGFYRFTGLDTGTYVVVETDPKGFHSTADGYGENDNMVAVRDLGGGTTAPPILVPAGTEQEAEAIDVEVAVLMTPYQLFRLACDDFASQATAIMKPYRKEKVGIHHSLGSDPNYELMLLRSGLLPSQVEELRAFQNENLTDLIDHVMVESLLGDGHSVFERNQSWIETLGAERQTPKDMLIDDLIEISKAGLRLSASIDTLSRAMPEGTSEPSRKAITPKEIMALYDEKEFKDMEPVDMLLNYKLKRAGVFYESIGPLTLRKVSLMGLVRLHDLKSFKILFDQEINAELTDCVFISSGDESMSYPAWDNYPPNFMRKDRELSVDADVNVKEQPSKPAEPRAESEDQNVPASEPEKKSPAGMLKGLFGK